MNEPKPAFASPSAQPADTTGLAAPAAERRRPAQEETGAEYLARTRQLRHRREVYSPRPEGRIT